MELNPQRNALVAAVALLVVFAVGFTSGYVLPILEQRVPDPPRPPREVAQGREVYQQEACWYCHTQQVRPVPMDQGLGPATRGPHAPYGSPPMDGLVRLGPDLGCYGDRVTGAAETEQVLRNPKAGRPASKMPSYGFLTDEQLASLVAYLTSLTCKGASAE